MVYPKGVPSGKRTIILGKVVRVSPVLEIEYFENKTEILFTKPNKIEAGDYIRVFGLFRNNLFIADSFHKITKRESEHFAVFRKTVRAFYKNNSQETQKL
ncbi:hypothetical protein NEMIN01_1019 [Nematocida minor]|uniref:uncharacterized protein n=1 Tax=Nematocida minor TaxID=1912983 RepID=UPI0022211D70|nr:uncharacterized protein NEMIN01_1019 [Nematocida minor]KAI5190395.1 hypothetical protein NEMIN01_1019 [Nematocida minor]